MAVLYQLIFGNLHSLVQRNRLTWSPRVVFGYRRTSKTLLCMPKGKMDFGVSAVKQNTIIISPPNPDLTSLFEMMSTQIRDSHLRSYTPIEPTHVARMSAEFVHSIHNKFMVVHLFTLYNMIKIVLSCEHS